MHAHSFIPHPAAATHLGLEYYLNKVPRELYIFIFQFSAALRFSIAYFSNHLDCSFAFPKFVSYLAVNARQGLASVGFQNRCKTNLKRNLNSSTGKIFKL